MAEATYLHRVSYGETDAMGYVYHAEYIHIFERSRGEISRKYNFPYKEMEELGIMLPVKEVSCHYKYPAHYDELLQVDVKIVEFRKASVRFEYIAYNEDRSKVIAQGFTLHACTNKAGKPVAIPKEIIAAFQS